MHISLLKRRVYNLRMQNYTIRNSNLFLDRPYREYILTIKDMPADEKPREKLMAQGPEALSVGELLALVLTTGTVKEDVLEMSRRIIYDYGEKSLLAEKDANALSADLAIPITKACQIVACGELGRRLYDKTESGFTVIRSAKDAYDHLQDMRNLSKEHLRGLYLNSHNRIIRDEVISIGTINTILIILKKLCKHIHIAHISQRLRTCP